MVYNNSIAHIVSDLFLRRVSRFTGVKKRIATQSVRLMQILRGRDKKRRSSRASSSLNFRRPPSPPPLPAEIAAMRARRMYAYRITFFRRCLVNSHRPNVCTLGIFFLASTRKNFGLDVEPCRFSLLLSTTWEMRGR